MTKRMCEIAVLNKSRKPCKIIAHCYPSGVQGLVITINYDNSGKDYSLTHIQTGCSIPLHRFPTIKKTKEIALLFFNDCNWAQATPSMITSDPVIIEQYRLAMKWINGRK